LVEILRNKNQATKFQILVEVANSGPNIQQRDIAHRLGITPQAISDYISRLTAEGLIIAEGRSKYRVSASGTNWIIKSLRELRSYHSYIEKAITSISVAAAIADADIKKGQAVGLLMKDGVLYATARAGDGAKGIAHSDARAGQEVGVTGIEGIVQLEIGKVTILKVPAVEKGGSRMIDTTRLKKELKGRRPVAAIGIEAMVALKEASADCVYAYGAVEAAVEAARSGLSPLVVCVDDSTGELMGRLEEEKINYEIVNLSKE